MVIYNDSPIIYKILIHIFSLFNTVNKGPITKLIIVKLIKKIYSSCFNSNFIPNTIDRNKIAINYKLTVDTPL